MIDHLRLPVFRPQSDLEHDLAIDAQPGGQPDAPIHGFYLAGANAARRLPYTLGSMPRRNVPPDVHIATEPSGSTEVSRFLFNELFQSNVERTNDGRIESLCVTARNAANDVVGGVYGEVYWGWLNILVLWVAPALRRHGVGTQLLAHVETEAVAKSCRGIYLDTFTFQNPQLYLRAGYEVFGTLDQFPNGHSRHFLRKQLHAA